MLISCFLFTTTPFSHRSHFITRHLSCCALVACLKEDGTKLISAGTDNVARMFDLVSGTSTQVGQHEGPIKRVRWFEMPQGGILATGSWDKTLKVCPSNLPTQLNSALFLCSFFLSTWSLTLGNAIPNQVLGPPIASLLKESNKDNRHGSCGYFAISPQNLPELRKRRQQKTT